MRFLNLFRRESKAGKGRGGARRGPAKRKRKARRGELAGIDWRLVRRATPFAAALAVVAGLGWLWHDGWFGRQVAALQNAALAGSADLGLRIDEVLIEGRERTDGALILERLGLARGVPIFAIDPQEARHSLEGLPWVRRASVERQLPDTIYIRLEERRPMALWQERGKVSLIDQHGEVIAGVEPRGFAHLPLVVGPGAASHAAKLIAVVNSEPDLSERVTAAVRIAERRWNVQIEGRIDVRLPEEDAGAAWAQLAKIERQQSLLSRDVVVIDLRLPDRLVVRTNPERGPLGRDSEGENT